MEAPVSDEIAVADLSIQLLIGALFVVLMVTIHSGGLVAITRGLKLHQERSIPNEWGLRAAALLSTYGVLLFALHFIEIFIFAAFYRWTGSLHTMEAALYYSASSYATLGVTANFSEEWRLVGSLEALIGFVLIGWSTAAMVRTLRRIVE
jgi:hypothetical protein